MIERTLTNAVTAAAGTQDAEDKWLGALTPDGPLKDKFDACRELAVAGSKKSVPVLAGLLDNAELSHMARYALETIPDPSVDEALREAAGKLEGDLLAGVIGSIGVRRDAGAVDLLAKHLDSGNGTVARAAARALGNIGTVPAAKAIGGAIRGTAPGNRLDFAEGLYRCAEAIHTLAELGDVSSLPMLRMLQNDPDEAVAGAAKTALSALS